MDDEHPALAVRKAGDRAEEEIAAPTDRLQDPEGAILVLEERVVETDPTSDRSRRRADRRGVGRTQLRRRPPVEDRAVGRHSRRYRWATRSLRDGVAPRRAGPNAGVAFDLQEPGMRILTRAAL